MTRFAWVLLAGGILAPAFALAHEAVHKTHSDEDHAHKHHDHDHDHAHDHGEGAGHRHADAHVHGEAELTAAMDGTVLVVELRSAVWNIMGFEHAPKTDDQWEALEGARNALLDASRIVSPDRNAKCEPSAVDLALGDDGNGSGGFRDMTVTYTFECADPGALERLDVQAFGTFARLETVRAAFLGEGRQVAGVLTGDANRFALE